MRKSFCIFVATALIFVGATTEASGNPPAKNREQHQTVGTAVPSVSSDKSKFTPVKSRSGIKRSPYIKLPDRKADK